MSNELIVTVEENKFILEIETTVDNTANKIDIDSKNHDVVEISTSNPVSGGGGGSTLTQEQVQDYVGGLLTGTSGISTDYQDSTNNLSITVTGINSSQINNFNSAVDARVTVASISAEEIMDVVGGVSGIYGVSGIAVNYKDTDDRLDIGISGITESQIVDLQSYLTSFTETNDLSSAVTWVNVPDGNITESSVAQHSGALQITESQVVDLQPYLTSESNDLGSAVTWANVPDTNITQSSVVQHSGALLITESQITDLQSYLTSYTETDTLANVTSRGNTTTTTCVIPFYYGNQAAFPNATTYHGAIAHSHSDGAMYFAHGGVWNKLANDSDIANSDNWDTAYTTVNNSGNAWTQAYNWGDHGEQGYLTAHPSISAASSSDNSSRTYIQDILLDSNGHVTGIAVATETVTDTTYTAGSGLFVDSSNEFHANVSGIQSITSNSTTSTAGRSYAVQIDSNDRLVVNVPWIDTDTTYTAGSGLQLNGTTFDALTATVSSSGITTLSNTINTDQDKALTPKSINDAVSDGTIHPNIAGATTSNGNSGNTFLQNIVFDSNGHVTSVSVGTASEGDGGGGLSSVLGDDSPQLGGDLDLNSFAVSGQGSVDINGSGIFSLNVVATGMGIGIEQPNTIGNEAGLHIADRNYPELHFTNDTTGHSNTDGAHIQLNGTTLNTTNRKSNSSIQFHTFDGSSVTKQRLGLGPTQSVFNASYDNNDFLVYGTGTTPVIHVDAFNERLGIGNSSPVHALDVVGTGRFVHEDGHCGLMIEDSEGSGVHIGDCAYYGDTYAGMKHSSQTGSEYMIISRGDYTFLSASDNGAVVIRGGANNTDSELRVKDVNDGEDAIIFNEQGADRDIRMESVGDQNAFHLDANANNIGIGTPTPAYKLTVVDSTLLGGILVSGGATPGLSLIDTTDNSSHGIFGDDNGKLLISADITSVGGSSSAIRFGVQNATQAVVTSSGVGIGTETPSYQLDVVGTGRFVHTDGHCGLIIEDAGGSGLHLGDCAGHGAGGTYTGMKHSNHSSADEYMILTDGTSTFIGGKTGSTTYLRSGGNGQTYQAQVASSYFGVGTSDGNRLNIDNETVTLNKGTGNYDFKVMPYNNENPIIHCDVDSGSYGRLGIGRSPDNYVVDVSGSMRINPLSTATLSLTVNRNANRPSIVSEGDTSANQWLILDSSGNACALNYFSSNDVLLAYGGGNVGIGTSTTTRKVTVKGNSVDNSAAILIQPEGLGSTTTDGLLLSQNNAGLGYLWNFENKGLAFGTNNLERMRIDDDGRVGVGTSVPGTMLDVRNGDILVGTKLLVGSGVYSQTSPGAYFGLKHTSLTGPSEYMIMSAGTHTYLSAKEDSDVYIRGGGNKVDHQIVVTESGITLGKYRPAASSVDAEHDVELVYDDGGCVRIADRGGSGIMIGDCANSASDIYAGMKHTSMAGSNDYMVISSGADTFISAANNNHVFIRGGGNSAESQISVLDVGAGSVGIVLNENGSDRDIRMEGTGNTNLFRLDASEDRIGIGTSSPETTLHISGSGDASIVNMTVSSGSWAGLLIRDSDDINVGGLQFGNSGVADVYPDLNRAVFGGSRASGVPFLLYQGRDEGELAFKENNKRLVLDSDGNTILTAASTKSVFVSGVNLGINTISPSYKLDVAGTFSADSININEAFTFPTSDGTAEQSLVTDGAGNVTWSGISSGGLSNISEDTNPQLGGNLDLNSKNINGNGNISNTGIIKVTHTDGVCGLMVEDTAGSGVHIGDCAYSAGDTYTGMKHTNHTDSQEYMIISAGHSTVVSSKAGTSTYIRAGGNTTAYQGIFGTSAFGIGPNGNKFRVNSQAAIVNNGTGNLDFKVYAQDEAVPLIHADAALNKVGIGTSTPAKKLHVVGDLLIDDGSAIVFDANGLKITDDTVGATLDTNLDDAIVIGEGSKSYADKSINIANGRFSSDGDSQKILQVLRGSTTNTSLFYLSNTGSTASLLMSSSDTAIPGTAFNVDGILLPSSAVFTFTIHVSCRKQSSDDSAAWVIRGAVRNSKGWADGDVGTMVGASNISSTMNYHLIGSPIVESYIDPALAGVTAEVTTSYYNPSSTNTINNAWFGIQVNGLSSTNLRWSATVDGVLTTY